MDVAKQQRYIIRDTQQQDTLKDTKSLLKHEILTEQYRIIKDWKPQSDVCVYKTSLFSYLKAVLLDSCKRERKLLWTTRSMRA